MSDKIEVNLQMVLSYLENVERHSRHMRHHAERIGDKHIVDFCLNIDNNVEYVRKELLKNELPF